MNIEISIGTDRNDSEWQTMKIDGEQRLSVHALCECPEDAMIERDLVSCQQVATFMREAYEAGKRGEEFNVIEMSAKEEP